MKLTIKSKEFNILPLTIVDTNILKGIALLLLLLHHLFYIRTGLYDDIQIYQSHYLVNEIGWFSKLCVAIFVFLSGYGLTIQANKTIKINIFKFYKHRFLKLYLNYWFIWLIFVPIGILFFHRTFEIVYVNHIWEKFLIDIWGLSYAFGFHGYNATWWFYSCIIILYLIFPFLYKLLKKYNIILIIISLIIYFYPFSILGTIREYLISFVLGMIFANGIKVKLPYIDKWLLTIIFIITCCVRNQLGVYAILWDNVICIVGIILYQRIKLFNSASIFLEFLGKHSMNIFLFHTFIYSYYFENLIFFSRNPIIIFCTLLFVCILISIIIELIKNKIGFYKINI